MKELTIKCNIILPCQVPKVQKVGNTYFYLMGTKKRSEDDKSTITVDGDSNVLNYEYVDSVVVASGKTRKQLIDSCKEYKKLSKMNWIEYVERVLDTKLSDGVKAQLKSLEHYTALFIDSIRGE